MRVINWQFYPNPLIWEFKCNKYYDEDFGYIDYFVSIGPLQIRLRK